MRDLQARPFRAEKLTTKEDVVVADEYDPLLLRLLAAAPPDEPPIPALRRDATDIEVRAFGGAVTGAMLAAIFAWIDGGKPDNLGGYIDRALAHLESGLTL